MTADPQPRVRAFHYAPSYCDEAFSTCIIHSVSGSPHGVDITIRQARALQLELSRAILGYELIATDDPLGRMPAGAV